MSIRIQVLLVEDDEISAQAARTLLERLGCVVDHAIDGAEAIDLFSRGSYDLILMDGQMRQMQLQLEPRGVPGRGHERYHAETLSAECVEDDFGEMDAVGRRLHRRHLRKVESIGRIARGFDTVNIE